MADLTRAQRWAMVNRPDIVAQEAGIVRHRRLNWRGRLAEIGDLGLRGGGSTADRRQVIEGFAALEEELRG